MAEILIIDDDPLFAETVADKLDSLRHTSRCAHTLTAGLAAAVEGRFDVVLLDVCLPDGNGLLAIDRLRSVASDPQVIIITGQGDPDGAELAIRHGAWCYLEKSSIVKEITLPLTRALQYRQALSGQKAVLKTVERDQLVGESPRFLQCLDMLAKAAAADASVLVSGESGTGKEAFARAIHANSRRRSGNFVVVDCTALPEQLVESVLFGHVKGAFTGADRANRGLIRHADKGTLFLDEIGELPLATQKSFLRVLQERTFCPVGSQEECHSDFRLICATNRDLVAMTEKGVFREDLLYRLRGLSLHLPPLRERDGDIPRLVEHFLSRLVQRYGQERKECLPDFMDYLTSYAWPGNVRELSQAMESAFAHAVYSPVLFPQHLPVHIRTAHARANVRGHETIPADVPSSEAILAWREAKDAFEREYTQRLLRHSAGNIMEAGRLSGLSRTRLYQLIRKFQLG
ncbi:two component, sigma54 specific, transcriptional regulator, Fis family [Desulfobulbus propionicus DSM 2032]|jgi:two-component system NtrC family response regulator|uniref:Two component, sigma54 specific, transcriptional regulator, Fis family n=1 Tax=Desulfobulbus propionicus (strain ATCC 33891 / DSM 2032 / VKM B-1956 / 1pr3) TaxID=577650 RepID=A0A7U4DNK3_DESPD|nr:sigma-54 dependent transcriptional regulator [Desulfobulbus propionicus]ADW17007.1 two component, sigma54 specific, transcriptional regulator, Fis family [Desulfobulbus propionicus DSM 2032]